MKRAFGWSTAGLLAAAMANGPARAADPQPGKVYEDVPAAEIFVPSAVKEPAVPKKSMTPTFGRPSAAPEAPAPVAKKPVAAKGEGPAAEQPTAASLVDIERETEQDIMLEWKGPVQIKVGKPFTYELIVRNIGNATVDNVIVCDQVPPGMTIQSVEPRESSKDGQLTWRLGSMEPQAEKTIKMVMTAQTKGDISCHATVTATSPAVARFRISEPQLSVRQTNPTKVMVGDPIAVTITVHNPGDGPAENVVIRSQLSDGLKTEKGSEFSYQIGALAAGETRTLQIVCSTTKGGEQTIKTFATADEGALKADGDSKIQIIEPKLEVATEGPRRRYLGRSASYNVVVSNAGDALASNVKVMAVVPAGFKYSGSSNGGRYDATTRTIDWFVGTVNPGEKKDVSYKCVAIQAGSQTHAVAASAQRGLTAESTAVTSVEGISALLLEVVDVDDPVEVGADTSYEIRVTNQGSSEATNVEIRALVPEQMTVKGGQGPTMYRVEGQEVVFAPLPKLAPRADAIYRILVRGGSPGDARFKARLTSSSLTDPVIEEESTKIYED